MLYPKWKCFGCLHVKTATVMVGYWHLIIHILGFMLFICAYYFTPSYCDLTLYGFKDRTSNEQQTGLQLVSNSQNMSLWTYMSLISFVATILLISGVMKKRYTLILPFFCIQLFDILFDISVITIYILLSNDANEFFSQLRSPPFQRYLVHYSSRHRKVFAILYILVSFSVKAYLAHVVYLCCKFLKIFHKLEYKRRSVNENSAITQHHHYNN